MGHTGFEVAGHSVWTSRTRLDAARTGVRRAAWSWCVVVAAAVVAASCTRSVAQANRGFSRTACAAEFNGLPNASNAKR